MSDVTAFLRARLDDDEKAANESGGTAWHWASRPSVLGGTEFDGLHNSEHELILWADSQDECELDFLGDVDVHIARHDPARVLREVSAKRGVIREMEAARTNLEERGINVPFFITWTLWHLAAVYSDHPDYQKEWEL